jgi:hypothetical protein
VASVSSNIFIIIIIIIFVYIYIYIFISEKNHNAAKCEHSESERTLFGTWPTPELHLAVQNGYRVIRYHEIWKYDDVGPSLFRDFLMSLKFINSGFPSNVPEEKRQEWLDRMIEKEVGRGL